MRKIKVKLAKRSYPIFVGSKIGNIGSYLKKQSFTKKALVVTNPKIKKLYYSKLALSLKKAGFEVNLSLIPDGERYKNLDTVKKLYSAAVKYGIDRKSLVVSLGGGVIGDIAGFFAATYLRGVPFVQVPTTLLAMVDSSVGGKTGVDLPQGKNLVGAFYQPKLVWIDISTLKTLPKKELRNGMAEVIKYGIIKDAGFFRFLTKNVDNIYDIKTPVYEKIIAKCCKIKAWVVEQDEKETKGIREILNFGHTYGHAIEALTGFKGYSHGEAVAIGMSIAAALAGRIGLLGKSSINEIKKLISVTGLPTALKKKLPLKKILSAIYKDKKVLGKKLRFVLPIKIGKVFVHKGVEPKKLKEVIK
ncbi:MAG: 3-dehydroquinate synthase [Endomicrobiales bacterium]|nr:3-dehydroquinate synthase [Endomicrobiales bacterium]